jgi:integrase
LPGFGIRLRASGAQSWHVQYDLHGRTRRMSLGTIAVLTLGQARKAARQILARVKLGEDPAGDRAETRAKAKHTVGALIEPFLMRQERKVRPRTFEGTKRHLLSQAAPLHATAITKVDRRAIADLLTAVERKSGPVAANRLRSSLMTFMGWAVGSGYIETNPVDYTPQAIENGPRKRLLSLDELCVIWRTAGEDYYGSIVKLLLTCGLRRTEIGDLKWTEVNLEKAVISLPAERTKAGIELKVPLSAPALAVLKTQPQDGRTFVFGLHDRGYRNWSAGKNALDAKLAAAGHKLAPWTPHDFRRAISTTLNEQGVRPDVVEAILGHVIPGIRGVYNLAQHVDARRRALERWADYVTGRKGAEVLPLRSAG